MVTRSSLVILGAVAILVPLFAFFTWRMFSRHKT